jgi:hypothetical protein
LTGWRPCTRRSTRGLCSDAGADVLFIPHITVGAAPDFSTCDTIARSLSPLERQVRGRVETLDLIEVHAGRVHSLHQWRLGALALLGRKPHRPQLGAPAGLAANAAPAS